VRLTQDVDNYPTCLIRAGETLTRITDEGTYWVKLDTYHPELAEWDNEMEIWDWSVEGVEFTRKNWRKCRDGLASASPLASVDR
jgi:hypothetical protein